MALTSFCSSLLMKHQAVLCCRWVSRTSIRGRMSHRGPCWLVHKPARGFWPIRARRVVQRSCVLMAGGEWRFLHQDNMGETNNDSLLMCYYGMQCKKKKKKKSLRHTGNMFYLIVGVCKDLNPCFNAQKC